MWLWTSRDAAAALATGSLSVILKAYRASTGTSQATLAATLGYDTSYISMIENGRRVISDATTLRRLVSHLGLLPHVLGLTDPQDADFISMIQFGESTIRLASVARQAGHSAAAINELWPLIWRGALLIRPSGLMSAFNSAGDAAQGYTSLAGISYPLGS